MSRIARAEPTRIAPLEWGGWGYRMTTPAKSGLILRAGPGLVVQRTDGHRFSVTVDDPQTPAALLNALVTRART